MQSCQAKPIAVPTSSLTPQSNSQTKDGDNEKNRGETAADEKVTLVRIYISGDIDETAILTY
jgi:hypothetical protein